MAGPLGLVRAPEGRWGEDRTRAQLEQIRSGKATATAKSIFFLLGGI